MPVHLRCNQCEKNHYDFCVKLKEPLPHGYAKLHLGGIINDPTHRGLCGEDKNNATT
jgi:hypothetical protein